MATGEATLKRFIQKTGYKLGTSLYQYSVNYMKTNKSRVVGRDEGIRTLETLTGLLP